MKARILRPRPSVSEPLSPAFGRGKLWKRQRSCINQAPRLHRAIRRHIGTRYQISATFPLVTRQHALYRALPARELPLPRGLAHVRLEAVFEAPVVGEFRR